jgi:hypothetical protein
MIIAFPGVAFLIILTRLVTLAKNCCQVSATDILRVINVSTMKNNFKISFSLSFSHIEKSVGSERSKQENLFLAEKS